MFSSLTLTVMSLHGYGHPRSKSPPGENKGQGSADLLATQFSGLRSARHRFA